MAQERKRRAASRKGMSWELMGILAIVGLVALFGIWYLLSDSNAIVKPAFSSLDPAYDGSGVLE